MFIYTGKLDCEHASKEMITVVFPAEFQLNDPVSAYWQWSNDPKLHKKNTSVANVRVTSPECDPSPAHTSVV